MVIMIVDNDSTNLCSLAEYVKRCMKDAEVVPFSDSVQAMDYLREHEVNVVFTEIIMQDVSGFALNRYIRDVRQDVYVIFMSESGEYAIHAWEAHVNGYIQKPIDYEKVRIELEYAIR